MIYSVLQRRRAALLDCDWDIRQAAPEAVEGGSWMVEGGEASGTGSARYSGSAGASPSRGRVTNRGNGAGVDQVLADEQAAFLRERYDGIENFRDAVGFLFTGLFRGFAHLEKQYGVGGAIERLEPVEQPSSPLSPHATPGQGGFG